MSDAPRRRAIFPEGVAEAARAAGMSPAICSGTHLFLTGITGSGPDGAMSADPVAQFRAVFEKAAGVLDAAGLTLDALVEMTSYHIGLRDHFEAFDTLRREVLSEPYPAWTAVEVAGLRRPGAVVEVRFIAQTERAL
ncbi:RidA family protein [Rhodophyticola sp.]|jgi:enamine deaminase RidA (YjgF/YER057c/UK114 family)|uniref:RidA family protein n=2 Tax=Rhodobacterales TaxID=204455 RepID=UPI001B1916F8|nr:RidA family protein [Roseicyclus sp.]MBO6624384.1 RidA family protein [Roseicyclus sp.]MBO6922608.1 RidA family protein [Roseicyclus sp.]